MKILLPAVSFVTAIYLAAENGLYAQPRVVDLPQRFSSFADISFEHISLEHGLSQATVYAILQDAAGFMWFGTQDGLNHLDFQTGRVTRYQHDPKNPQGLSHNRVTSILEDDDGRLWIGTLGGGLVCLDPRTGSFTHYQADPKNASSISSNHVMCLYADPAQNEALWIGTYGGGLNRFDLKGETFSRFEHDPADPNTLSDNRVFDICSDASGALWIGTFAGGLNRCDPGKNVFRRFQNDPLHAQSLSADFVRAVFLDQSDNLWIGTHLGGLNKFDLKPKKFWHYRHDPNQPESLQNDFVNAIHQSPEETLWIGTNTGLDKLERDGKAFQHLALLSPEKPSDKIYVAAIWQQDANTLWLGTLGEGLLKYQIATGTAKQFKHDPQNPTSLSDNRVNALHQSRQGILWLGTWRGLNAFNILPPRPLPASSRTPRIPTASATKKFCASARIEMATFGLAPTAAA